MEPKWTLQEGIDYIRALQPVFRGFNYHLALAGSVLNNGRSDKDLDIIVMSMNNDKPVQKDQMETFLKTLGAFINTKEEYLMQDRILWKTVGSKPVDWFIYQ